MSRLLAAADRFRDGRRLANGPFKEWHHFVVHGAHGRIIVNFSLSDDEDPGGRRRGRVIVLADADEWVGAVAEFSGDDVEVATTGVGAWLGASSLTHTDGAYLIELRMPEHDIDATIRLVPRSAPFARANQPLGDATMSWLFVPRMLADGWLRVGSVRFAMRSALAYHDHNWGAFRWGDDFGWMWASALPAVDRDPWSIVFMCVTDRAHSASHAQCLYLWEGDRPAAMFRDAAVSVEREGLLGAAPRYTIPGALSLLTPGTASDTPAKVSIMARNASDGVSVEFHPRELARVVVPAEVGSSSACVLHEISADVTAHGHVGGRHFTSEATGVVELFR